MLTQGRRNTTRERGGNPPHRSSIPDRRRPAQLKECRCDCRIFCYQLRSATTCPIQGNLPGYEVAARLFAELNKRAHFWRDTVVAAVQRHRSCSVAAWHSGQRDRCRRASPPLAAHQLVPFWPFLAVFYFSTAGGPISRQEAGRSGVPEPVLPQLLSSHPLQIKEERYAVAKSQKQNSARASALRRTASSSPGASPGSGDRVAPRKRGVCRRPGQSQGAGGKSRPGSRPGRGQVTDRSRTSHIQVADRSQTGRGQVADRSQTGRGQVTDKDGSANHLLRSHAESTLGLHFWS